MPKIHGDAIPFPRSTPTAIGEGREYAPIECEGENPIDGTRCGGKIFERINVVSIWKNRIAETPDVKAAFAEQAKCVKCGTCLPPEAFR